MTIQDKLQQSVPSGEHILASLESGSLLGNIEFVVAVTQSRMVFANKKGLFSWDIVSKEFLHLRPEVDLYLTEGVFFAAITFRGFDGDAFFTLKNLPKAEARRFIAIVSELRAQSRELAADQTKTCPDCAETVKLMASVCKHCAFRF